MTDHLSKLNSKHLTKNFPRDFDAHIYFEETTLKEAQALREAALTKFKDQQVFVGFLIERAVGPHPVPMFEINFPKELFSEVVLWLLHHHKDLSVLVHELTGNDYLDHTEFALWIGRPVALELNAFKKKH